MNIFGNMKCYFNHYLFGYRYDWALIEFFKVPYNNAILRLNEEGYDVEEKFSELINKYQSGIVLNNEESSFVLKVLLKSNSSKHLHEDIKSDVNNYKNAISEMKANLRFAKNEMMIFRLKSHLSILKIHSNILQKEIQKLNPIVYAVLLRKLSKFLLEKLIYRYINDIDVINYVPSLEILKKYHSRLDGLKKFDMAKKIKNEIDALELANLRFNNTINSEKTAILKPSIIYKKDNDIIHIIQTLDTMKKYCNNVIHLNGFSRDIKFNFNDSLFGGIIDGRNSFSIDENNNLIIRDNNNDFDESFKIELKKVIKYIAYGSLSPEIITKLRNLSNQIQTEMNNVKDILTIENDANNWLKEKNNFFSIKNTITQLIKALKIPQYFKFLCTKNLQNVIGCVKKNKYKENDISTNNLNINQDEREIISFINEKKRKLNIYEKIKFNCCFERNIQIYRLQKEIDNLEFSINRINGIMEDFNMKKNNFNENYTEIVNDLELLDNSILIFDRNLLFNKISVEQFINTLNEEFSDNNEKIDLLSNEINNFYLFIYLLKRNAYDEESYKTTAGINNDYI